MEPQKHARYSKFLDAEELEEIMMEEKSDEELEELNEFIEPTEEKWGYCYKDEGASKCSLERQA
jgi:hypothetical protein